MFSDSSMYVSLCQRYARTIILVMNIDEYWYFVETREWDIKEKTTKFTNVTRRKTQKWSRRPVNRKWRTQYITEIIVCVSLSKNDMIVYVVKD